MVKRRRKIQWSEEIGKELLQNAEAESLLDFRQISDLEAWLKDAEKSIVWLFMVKKSDIGGKRLIGLSPQAWGRWVTGDKTIKVQEIINSELQWIERESDVLLKAHSPECGDFILLNELQLRHDAKMPRRMRAYAALVEEKYGLLVYPVVVNILQPGPTEIICSRYESEIMGCRAYQDYRVINLWEIEAETVFEQNSCYCCTSS